MRRRIGESGAGNGSCTAAGSDDSVGLFMFELLEAPGRREPDTRWRAGLDDAG